MAAAPSRRRPDPGGPPDTRAPAADRPPVYDPLDMLVTSEPVAELDDALACLARQLHQAAAREDGAASTLLRCWMDGRLDERNTFLSDPTTAAFSNPAASSIRRTAQSDRAQRRPPREQPPSPPPHPTFPRRRADQ